MYLIYLNSVKINTKEYSPEMMLMLIFEIIFCLKPKLLININTVYLLANVKLYTSSELKMKII